MIKVNKGKYHLKWEECMSVKITKTFF